MTQVDTRTTAVANKIPVQSVRPCLTFKEGTEEAINFYVSLFPNSKVLSLLKADAKGPLPEGSVLHASFQLDGQEYTAFDGGPSFTFTEGFSFVATCETQEEIDEVWARLTDGGE
ncbi:MAG TPA: VOC family protein, partial [Candidatus Dormibacteraeota bacterium]